MEGIGSALLASEGVSLLRDYGDISVIGVTEALRRLPAIRAALSAATERVRRPDIGAVLLVDFPDFNFRVGKAAARLGIPVVYYIPPQVWAWRPGRAKTLARFTKGAVVLFPFEEEYLRRSGVNAVFAGHPILEEIAPYLDASPDPERFGVVKFDENMRAVRIEEKPKEWLSDFALTGLYIYDSRVVEAAKEVRPSARGEIEITELHNWYLSKGELEVAQVKGEWIDAGTFDSLLAAQVLAKEKLQEKLII